LFRKKNKDELGVCSFKNMTLVWFSVSTVCCLVCSILYYFILLPSFAIFTLHKTSEIMQTLSRADCN